MRTGTRAALLVGVLATLASGCGSLTDDALRTTLPAMSGRPADEAPPSSSTKAVHCGDPTISLRPPDRLPPPGAMPAGTTMRTIQERGRLIAGVDQNTLRFAYLDPLTGRLEGFEIDLVRELARAILGDPTAVQLRVLKSTEREDAVLTHRVDLLVDAMTITCERRQKGLGFSVPYFEAGQRLLVRSSSTARRLEDLAGERVCATATSTSMTHLRAAHSGAIPYAVSQRTDCLVALQEGAVTAITSDDAILLGLHAQDPYTKLIGPRFAPEPYGIAVDRNDPGLVRFVNGVLERIRRDGTWQRMSDRWLRGLTGAAHPPVPRYGD